jgi:CheY-like chemotaxis protein
MNQILFMSSDPVLRQKNIEVLSQNGFTVSDSADCLGGLLKVDKSAFDIIIIDEELSDYDGYEACGKIRQHSDIPIILIGTRPDSEVWDSVEELGFDLYMSKPVSPRELLARIKAIVRRPSPERKQVQTPAEEKDIPHVNAYENKQIIEEPDEPVEQAEEKDSIAASATADKSKQADTAKKKPSVPVEPPQEDIIPETTGTLPTSEAKEKEKSSKQKTPAPDVPVIPTIEREPAPERVIPTPVIPDSESYNKTGITEKQPQKPETRAIYCTNCGQASQAGHRFCGFCGKRLPDISPTTPTAPEKMSYVEPIKSEAEKFQPADIESIKLETEKFKPVETEQFKQEPIKAEQFKQEPAKVDITEIIRPSDTYTKVQEPPQSPPIITQEPVPPQPDSSKTVSEQEAINQNGSFQIWEDGRAVKLVEALVNGKITDIIPIIDLSSKSGFSYPQVDNIIDGDDEDTMSTLESLEKANILIKKPYEKLLMDPDGTFQLIPQERCPNCDSANLISGQLVEHFACGYVGMEQDFKVDHKYVCPKCHRDMKLIGTDYRNAGIHNRCLNCNEVFTTPIVKWRSLNTHKVWNADELRQVWVYSYSFSPEKKDWLEFQLKPKAQLIEFLKIQGYDVQEFAQLSGSSGAVHTIDIMAVRDDIMTKINLGIGILVAMPGESEVQLEELFKYDTRAYDIGINYKVVIAIPKLNAEAIKFAERQMIRTFESKTLGALVTHITNQPRSSAIIQTEVAGQGTRGIDESTAASEPGKLLVRFLRNRGYEVFERAKILGKSGAEHIFDLVARKDDGIVIPTIAIDMSILPPGQEVDINELSQFDSEAYDSGIRNKVFIGLPGITKQAMQFAKQQKIKTIEANDLRNFM